MATVHATTTETSTTSTSKLTAHTNPQGGTSTQIEGKTNSDDAKPYVRLAEPEDFDQVVEVAHNAFVHDPMELYVSGVKEITEDGLFEKDSNNLRTWLSFLLKMCVAVGGRVTVVVDASLPKIKGRERVCAAAYWLPPNKRPSALQISILLKSGIWEAYRGWGVKGIYRACIEYLTVCDKTMKKAYRARGLRTPVADSWYLLHMMTDPKFQGRGYMSMVIREAFSHAPDAMFTLEASTPKSRDRYAHLGYEIAAPFVIGRGKVGANGLPAKGKEATGVEGHAMLKSMSICFGSLRLAWMLNAPVVVVVPVEPKES
ncbi:hypothetical protein CC1G_01588 [Coprinopsis cinerea okayama7|uniref:N-acetyltransferase domain-containing protein n=1 Tax=Coprinopsis cinerea (strain Okayama-7 / 130 / ATCC MYA-4618 / FGSC 9003) TaxID=240176 RepID=A8NI54_COPC7|nr:hypothetical protein CC1G_01588 [Coprinopsis cinerea okayama7\|eukprot:XP_001833911.2 hypothetical protein CC1G_01588 [Coprinopsis cinerea okayama7\